MELTQNGFFEELLALKRDSWNTFPSGVGVGVGVDEFFLSGGSSFDSFNENPILAASNASLLGSFEPNFNEVYPFVDGFTVPDQFGGSSTYTKYDHSPPLMHIQNHYPSVVEDEELGLHTNSEEGKTSCKEETEQSTKNPVFNMGLCEEKVIKKSKKVEGQPSKNLMAERRRRKRLNDRLSMLRSIVPKISKMDRTSILGDTIDYMKELLERINKLQEEKGVDSSEMSQHKMELKPNGLLVRNCPKFDVERRNKDTQIQICCGTKPGLLLSTVNTIEELGLEIQHCVISCFNEFSLQASCSEAGEKQTDLSSQDIKQALFRNAGYAGRCL